MKNKFITKTVKNENKFITITKVKPVEIKVGKKNSLQSKDRKSHQIGSIESQVHEKCVH
jgi:hypothetical protein